MQIRLRPNPSSPVGLIVSLLFQLIFVGVGCVALGYAYVQYRQGVAMQQVYLPAGIGGTFVFVGLFGAWRGWRAWRNGQQVAQREQQYGDAPWRVRPEWRSTELTEAGPSRSRKFFAILWNAMAWPLAAFLLYSELRSPNPDWAVLLVLLFPLGGLLLAWSALRSVLHRRKFGTTALVMEDMPGRLGESLRLRLKTGVRPKDAPDDGFHVRLSCYRRSVRYTTDSDGDRRREVRKDLLWRDEKRIRGRASGKGDRMEVLVAFKLPAEPPPSTPEKRENRIMWELDAEADLPGLDFQTAFELPVFASERRGDTPPDTAPVTGDETPDWTGDQEAGEARPAGAATPRDEMNPYAGYEVGTAFTEPESKGIAMERSPRGGLQLRFAAGRNKGMGAVFAAIAVATGIGGFFALSETFFGALIFLLFAGLTGYGAWIQLTTASTLTVEEGTVTLVRGPFGRGTPVTFGCADLADVSLQANGRAGSTTYYDLVLHRLDMEARQQASAGEDAIDQMAQFAERTGLAGSPEADQTMEQIKESIHKQSTQLKVASGLTNKQEADWIVTTIQQAAQREASFS